MEEKFALKAPRRVGEEEFLKYVDEKCNGSFVARRQILEFYEEMKRIDGEEGLHLTPESFGQTVGNDYGVHAYTDQAINLFFSQSQKNMDIESHRRFVCACRNASKDEIKMLAKIREKETKEIFANPFPPIGFADLFRYQFVNFVDEIVLESKPGGNNVGGSVTPLNNTITIYDHSEKTYKQTDKERFKHQKTWRHELTHIIAQKTDFDVRYKYLSPIFVQRKKSAMFYCDKKWCVFPDKTENKKSLRLIQAGATLISEIATDNFTQKIVGVHALSFGKIKQDLTNAPNAPDNCDLFVKKHTNGKSFHLPSFYLMFASIVNGAVQFSGEKGPFALPNNIAPTYRLQDVVYKYLAQGVLSPHLEKLVNERVSALTDFEMSFLEAEKSIKPKFFIILGNAYKFAKNNSGNATEFNSDTLLAQAIILDIQHNRFKSKVQKICEGCSGTLDEQQKLYKFLKRQLANAKEMDDWVIKPNTKLGNGEKAIYARYSLCNLALSKTSDTNPAQKVWAEYLETLANFTHKFAPHLLADYPFLKKELADNGKMLNCAYKNGQLLAQ